MTVASQPTASFPRLRIIVFILKAIVICAMLPLAVAPFIYSGKIVANFPYSLDREEGFILGQAMDMSKGISIYRSLAQEPYTVGNYPPIYPWIYSLALRAGAEGLAPGRLINAMATFGIALCIALTSYRVSRDLFIALVASLIFLAGYEVEYWIAFARVDLTALFFTALGLFLFSLNKGWKTFVPAALVFAIAAFTKQTEVLAPFACALALMISKRYKHFALFTATFLGPCILAFAILNYSTAGEFFKHTVAYNENEMRWWRVPLLGPHIAGLYGFEILTGLVLIIAFLKKSFSETTKCSVIFFAFLSLSAVISTGKAGADVNYLLTPILALALTIGVLLPATWQTAGKKSWVAIAAYALILIHVGYTWSPHIQAIIHRYPPDRTSRSSSDSLLLNVSEIKGDVLSEDAMFSILDHRPAYYQPFIMSQLAKENKWDQSPFIEELTSGRFAAIVTMVCVGPDCPVVGFTPEMQAAILANYELKAVVPVYDRQQRFLYILKENRATSP